MEKKERWFPGTRVARYEEKEGGVTERIRLEETDPHKAGRPVRTIWQDTAGNEVERCTYEYDADSRCVGEVWQRAGEAPRRFKHVYDEEGGRESYWEDIEQ